MTLGTGIFASTVLLVMAFCVLQATRHGKWLAIGKIAGVFLGALVCLWISYLAFIKYEDRPTQQQELDGVKLEMSMPDVRLQKGQPTKSIVIFPGGGAFEPDTARPAGNSEPEFAKDPVIEDTFEDLGVPDRVANVFDQFDDPPPMRVAAAIRGAAPAKNTWQWTYDQGGGSHLVVVFDNKSSVAAICGQSATLFGIRVGMPERFVADKLDAPLHTSIRQDGLSKIITYPNWRVAFEIEKAQVTAICVTTQHLRFVRELQGKR